MRLVQVVNRDHPLPTPLKVRFCDTFFSRLRGLTFRRTLAPAEGILLVQSRASRVDSAIHMLGVGFDLGVAWLDANWQVVDLKIARSWRPLYIPAAPAQYVLEVHPSRLADFHQGDRLDFIDE